MPMHTDTEDKVLVDLKSFPGVMELERVVDAYSDPINIPGGLIFGHKIVNTAYVSVFQLLYCNYQAAM